MKKTVVVTGASSGIGEEIARTFSQKGWRVLLIARNTKKLEELSQSLENPSRVLSCDLSDTQSIEQIKSELLKEDISALINNAGIYRPSSIDEDSDGPWLEQFETNLMSAVRLTRILWAPFKKRGSGSIVNISSTLALRPIPNTASYSASKAAMNNWTQTLAIEGAPHNIRANAICPGIVDTPIHHFHKSTQPEHMEWKETAQSLQPLGRIGQPEDIAPMVYQLCDDSSSWITGTLLNVDGGILLNS